MQQQSLEFFCDECGAANPDEATLCIACQTPLTRPPISPTPIKPVTVAPTPTLQVIAGAAPLAEELTPGTLLQNRYKIEREIGQGGYSVVYKARDTKSFGRRVAIKQINLRNLTSRQAIEATETFNRETTLLPLLKHAGIPHYYGHFTDTEHWYLVMEYIKGQTLEEYLQKSTAGGYCSVENTLRIGIALSSVLEYLHSQKLPLIFRDVKPANILLTPGKKLYLIDFGIARTFNPSKKKDTTPLGSPGYAAPEQYGKAQSDPRTDIYGLGATLQTLLTGHDPLELRAGDASRAPQPVPSHVQKLLHSMLESDADRRPYTMGTVKKSLQKSLSKVRRRFLFTLGAGIGAAFCFLSRLIPLLDQLGASPYQSGPNPFIWAFECIWILTVGVGVITLLIFFITPTKRPIAWGMLAGLVLAFLILIGIP